MTMPDARPPAERTIYRCGWCGFPTDAKGDQLYGVHTPAEADAYLAAHHGAAEQMTNGFCCPGGDQQGDRQRMQVTREMAIDAGDRSLEGTWITW